MTDEIPIISPEIKRIIDSAPSWPAMTCTNEEVKPVNLDKMYKAIESCKLCFHPDIKDLIQIDKLKTSPDNKVSIISSMIFDSNMRLNECALKMRVNIQNEMDKRILESLNER